VKRIILKKPLVFMDLETTGLSPFSDRIVEIALLKLYPDGSEKIVSYLVNPEMPIPEEVTAIHGITDEDVAEKYTFKQLAAKIKGFISNCDMAGFNIKRFDLPFLETEFKRAGIQFSRKDRAVIDSQVIYHLFEKRDLASAYYKYCKEIFPSVHVVTTADILKMAKSDGLLRESQVNEMWRLIRLRGSK